MSDHRRTAEDVKNRLQAWKDFDSKQTRDFYDDWAEKYEQDTEIVNYRAPSLVVDFFNTNFSGNREEVLVLDVACGSGLVAKLMTERGFRHFVGVDGSKGMLEQAEKTKLYKELKVALLGTEPLPAQTGAFDVVIIVGALREGHVPVSVVRELCSAAKPGGYICMSRADTTTEAGHKYQICLEEELQQMEEEGLWSHVITKEMDKYMMDFYSEQYTHGTMYLYRKSHD